LIGAYAADMSVNILVRQIFSPLTAQRQPTGAISV
jgi:hypothetical protein